VAYGVVEQYTMSVATGATISSHSDLSSRSWDKIYLSIPTMASGTDFFIQGSAHVTQAFRRIAHPIGNNAINLVDEFRIPSGAANNLVPIPNGIRYVKIELSTAMTSTNSEFSLICSD
jgi:hypothetical protein